jgi:WhiB family redox-sensing transcriptional regulator
VKGVTGVRSRRVRELLTDLGFIAPAVRGWRDQAACSGTNPEVFYPVGSGPEIAPRVAAAKQVCAGCPVRQVCLADVMSWEDPALRWGVVGGLWAADRSVLFENRRVNQIGEVA